MGPTKRQSLETISRALSSAQRPNVFEQIHKAFDYLRSLETPETIGSIVRERLTDGILSFDRHDSTTSVPFVSQDELKEDIVRRLFERYTPPHVNLPSKIIQVHATGPANRPHPCRPTTGEHPAMLEG